jgi:hypothetical protein
MRKVAFVQEQRGLSAHMKNFLPKVIIAPCACKTVLIRGWVQYFARAAPHEHALR